MMHFVQDFSIGRIDSSVHLLKYVFLFNNVKVITVTYHQFNESRLNEIFISFKNK